MIHCRYARDLSRVLKLLLLGILTGCAGEPSSSSPPPVSPRSPERIVSLTPATTEILFGLGVFDRVVGVSDYCVYPPAVATLPRLGSWQDARLEELTRLDPDLVVSGGIETDAVSTELRALEIPAALVPFQSLEDIFLGIEMLGGVVGEPALARELVAETRGTLDSLRSRVAGRDAPTVLLVVDRLPGTLRGIYVPTPESFLFELVRIAGGDPLAVTGGVGGYASVSLEALVDLDPEVIIETIQGVPGRFTEDSMTVWGQLPGLDAVETGRVYPIRDPSILHPSQRAAQTATRFARILHPEAFEEGGGATP